MAGSTIPFRWRYTAFPFGGPHLGFHRVADGIIRVAR